MNESLFKGRQLTVMPKRKNKPFMGTKGAMSFGGGRGASNPMAMMMAMMRGMTRGVYRGASGAPRGALTVGVRGIGSGVRGGAGSYQTKDK